MGEEDLMDMDIDSDYDDVDYYNDDDEGYPPFLSSSSSPSLPPTLSLSLISPPFRTSLLFAHGVFLMPDYSGFDLGRSQEISRQKSFEVLPESVLREQSNAILEEVMDMLALPSQSAATILLRHYKYFLSLLCLPPCS